jgi:DNA invertase Pin-like site-specific DNA recombinase
MAYTAFVAYFRVSSERQGRSGVDAQRAAVRVFVSTRGGRLVGDFTEVESGGQADRPELLKALAQCRLRNYTLVIAKLDRLSRNAAFLLTLRDSGARFVAADMPEASNLTIGILAVVAEAEREAISARTKAALQAAKARGVVLGTPRNLTAAARQAGSTRGNQVKAVKALARCRDLAPVVDAIINDEGIESMAGIAAALNDRGVYAPRGGAWSASQVVRVFDRLR